MIEQLKQQQLQLLAKKTLLNDDLAQVDKALGQIAAILQFSEEQARAEQRASVAQPRAEPQDAETPSE